MTEWLWIFVGFTFGMWVAFAIFLHFLQWEQDKWAKNGVVELNGAFYRLEKFKVDE